MGVPRMFKTLKGIIMKKYLIIFLFLTASLIALGFSKKPIQPVELPPEVIHQPQVQVNEPYVNKYAWSMQPSANEWNYYLEDSLHVFGSGEGIKTPCKKLPFKKCAAQLLSIVAKRESNFKPETSFNETGHLQGVVSRGLFQISKDSANQSAYGCGISNAKDLYNPHINIKCAVKILAYQANKTGTLIDGEKGGCGSYWSVCRSKNGKSESYKVIMKYMEKF